VLAGQILRPQNIPAIHRKISAHVSKVSGEYHLRNIHLEEQNSAQPGRTMKLKESIKKARLLARPYAITDGPKFRLQDIHLGDSGDLISGTKKVLLAKK
jgi:hypothetical protein